MGSQHPSPNVKTLCNFETQIWLEIITSRDAKSACFKGSRTSCREIIFGHFLGKFWPEKITSRDGCLLLIREIAEPAENLSVVITRGDALKQRSNGRDINGMKDVYKYPHTATPKRCTARHPRGHIQSKQRVSLRYTAAPRAP